MLQRKPRRRVQPRSRVSSRFLFMETLEQRRLLAVVNSTDPLSNSNDAPTTTNVSATFSEAITAGSATSQSFAVYAGQRGRLTSAPVTVEGPTITLDPVLNFFPGEAVQVTATGGIQGAATAVVPEVWQFRIAVTAGSGQLIESGQNISSSSNAAETGDLDGDGDLDVFLLQGAGNAVWLNDGSAVFGQAQTGIGNSDSRGASLGDLDSDGDLDVFVANLGGANGVWLNDGGGQFSGGATLGAFGSYDASLGDVDGDGDLDAFVANAFQPNRVWVNDGSGGFTDSGQTLGNSGSLGVELGDLDGDGDLDAIIANAFAGNRVWMNDGSGVFSDSGQSMGNSNSQDVDIGDLDGDGDLDAFVTQYAQADRVWINDGNGVFSNTAGLPGSQRGRGISLGDLDGDGDLDAFVANDFPQGNQIWENDGNGGFTDSGLSLNTHRSYDGAIGDLDGDGDLDIFSANRGEYSSVYLNQNLQPSVSLSADVASIGEAGETATVTATLSALHTADVTVDLGFGGTATATDDYTASANQIVIAIGATTGSVTLTSVQDDADEPDESVLVDITSVTNAQEAGSQEVTLTIVDDDEPIPMPDVTLSVDNVAIPENAGEATFSVTLSEVTTVPVTVDLGVSGTAAPDDYSVSATQVVIAPSATSGSITVTANQDEIDEPDETVIVEIVNVIGGTELGDQQQTTTITDDDVVPASFSVTALEPLASGFQVTFATELDPSEINLFDTQNATMGPPDLIVTGASSGPVSGSLIFGPAGGGTLSIESDSSVMTFIATGGVLAPDTYTVSLRSADNGFKDTTGALLDGNGDGTGGDDYVAEFTVDSAPDGARVVGLSDFVRGPGQAVNLPANESTGIPITISDGTEVRAVDLRISYDPTLLEITDATAPAGGTIVLNTTTPGLAILVYFNSSPLPAGTSTFINLEASVPGEDASENYGTAQVLDVHEVIVGDGNDNEFPVLVDDAVQLASFFSDVSGNGRVNAGDASQVARFAALIDSGFIGSLTTDPTIIGDISGNGRINAADASLVARFAALLPVDQIPPLPSGVVIAAAAATGGDVLLTPFAPPDSSTKRPLALEPLTDAVRPADRSGTGSALQQVLSQGSVQAALAGPAADRAVEQLVSGGDPRDADLVLALEEALEELLVGSLVFE